MSKKKETEGTESWGSDDEALVFTGDGNDFSHLVQESLETEDLAALLKSGDFEAEQFIPLKERMRIEGYFLGAGAPVMMNDPQGKNGEKRPVSTWRIKSPTHNVVMVIASGAGLDAKLGGIPAGEYVIVQKNGQRQVGSRRVNDFLVLHSSKKRIDVPKSATTNGSPTTTA